jgi:hypothetical protein
VILNDQREKIAKHFLSHIEVGDHAILHRTHRDDTVGRPAQHPLRLETNAFDLFGFAVDGDHGGLVQHDPFTLHIDEGVRGAEVDTNRVRGK